MKSLPLSKLSRTSSPAFLVIAAIALVPLATGCGASPADAPEAHYPSNEMPVGVDGPATAPGTDVAAGDPALAPQPLPLSGEAQVQEGTVPGDGQSTYGQAGGTTVIGGQEGDVAIGDEQPVDQYGDTDPSALTDFKPALDPYGHWVDDGTYGTVWVPSSATVGTDFTPYVSGGHWAYDDANYVWVSDYSWGWAPFHYGRWVYTGGYGWGWIPGRTYAGAWVSWRTGAPGYGYVGWAPLAPSWGWRGGYAVGIGFAPRSPYVFCPTGHLFEPGFRNNIVRGAAVGGIAANTRPYVQAAPSAHSAAHPTVSGPSPSSMGIAPNAVTHVSSSPAAQSQVAHAQQYAHPSSAVAAGAHAPSTPTAGRSASASGYGPRGGYAGSYGTSHGAVASAQQYRGVSPTPYRAPASSYSRSTSGVTRIGGGSSGYSGSQYSAPHASPSYSSPRYSTPSYHTPYAQHSSGSYSAPSYHAPTPSPSYSAPSGGGFHSSGGGGGRGGGGGGHGGGHR